MLIIKYRDINGYNQALNADYFMYSTFDDNKNYILHLSNGEQIKTKNNIDNIFNTNKIIVKN